MKNNSISEFGSEDIDLPGLDGNKEAESDEIETKETVTPLNVNITNQFMKKTKYQ